MAVLAGRMRRSALPDENIETSPHEEIAYEIGFIGRPTTVRHKTREPWSTSPSLWRETATLTDGLGRVRQTHRQAVVDGQPETIGETVTYDKMGNVADRYVAHEVDYLGGLYTTPPAGTGFTTYAYDALGRATKVTNPDATFRTTDFSTAWQTTAVDECANTADASCGGGAGGKTVEIFDALGRETQRQLWQGASFKSRTVFIYDVLGRLQQTLQGATTTGSDQATRIIHFHDTLGRKRFVVDPDLGGLGFVQMAHDAVGNLVAEDDAEVGRHVAHCYDSINL